MSFTIRQAGDIRRTRVDLSPGLYPHVDGSVIDVTEPIAALMVERLVYRSVTAKGSLVSLDRSQPLWHLAGYEVIGALMIVDPAPRLSWPRRIFRWIRRPKGEPLGLPSARAIGKDRL